MRYLFFFSVILIAVGGSHFYFWTRLVRDPAWPGPWRLAITFLLVLLAVSLPASFFLLRAMSPEVGRIVLFPVYVWMGMMLLLLTFFFATDLLRWGYQLVAWATGHPPAPRAQLGRLQALLVIATTVVLAAISIGAAMGRPRVRQVEVTLPGLAPGLDGTRLAQITDLHLGATLGRSWLEGVVDQVNSLQPDLIAITGDLVDGKVSTLRELVAPVKELRARLGVFFVTGNHEYYSGVGEWMKELPRLGVRVLRNEHVRVGGARGFDLAGVDDFSAGGMGIPGHGPDLPRALANRAGGPVVLLAHQPRAVREAAQLGVALQLSGHTHGGQIWPWTYLVRLQQPAVSGLARFGGATTLYTSDGTGFWGPPMRLGTRAEITVITLRAPRP